MLTKLLKFVPALYLSMAFFTSGSFLANGAELPYIGQECIDKFESRAGTSVQNGGDQIYLICFKSTDNPAKWVWSKDRNEPPAINWTEDPIAYGRTTPEDCVGDAKNSKFVDKYGRTYCEDGVWKNDAYEESITVTAWVPPLEIKAPEVAENVSVVDQVAKKALDDSAAVLLFAAFALMMTPAAIAGISTSKDSSSNNFPRGTSSEQGIPEYIEIRARRDEKLKVEGRRKKFLRFLLNPAVTLAKFRFFENYLRIRIEKISRFSPGLATIIRDGDYLRAVLGSITFFLYPLAIFIGIFGFIELQSQPEVSSPPTLLPSLLPSFLCIALMIGIGVLDSLAGALAGATFVLLVYFANVLPMGITSDSKRIFSTLVSIFLISCTPPLFAGALRKFDGLHRDPGRNWNYAVDYLLSPLVTGWMVWKVIGVISDLSGAEFEVQDAPIKIAALIWFVLIIRYFIEHYVSRNWGDRLNEMISNDVVPSRLSIFMRTVLKSAWIWLLITSVDTFKDRPSVVLLFIALFALPSLIKLTWKNPPEKLGLLNLRGAPKIAILFLIGIGLTQSLKDPKLVAHQELILEIALVPLLFFSIIDALTEEHTHTPRYFVENKRGVWTYRIIGAAIYIFIAANIFYMIKTLN
jgi:hypothetical protein